MGGGSKLTGEEVQRLQDALLSAFPTRSALAQMVRVGLEENLDAVAAQENLSVAVFELIRWAEAQGRFDELVTAARKANSGNPALRAFVENWPPASSPAPNSVTRVEPAYENDEVRALAQQLERARARKRLLEDTGSSTSVVDSEILDLRRRLREGGQLRAGDALEDGRYLLLEQIGRGGFASVWKALDRATGERVAIKVLHPDQAREPSRRERFFRGARVMAGLKHDAVVRVLNPHGVDGGYHYFVMELVEGEDLYHAVTGGRLPQQETVPLILRVGAALHEAHARGIVHRDVKPGNILLDGIRMPKLTDFDLVAAKDTTGGTRTGAMGTFLFTAPEQMNNAKEADARADVYGLGMVAVFCFHGGDLPGIAVRQPDGVIRALACHERIKVVLTKAIEVDPENRFTDAQAFCTALRAAVPRPRRPLPPLIARTALAVGGALTIAGGIHVFQALGDGSPADLTDSGTTTGARVAVRGVMLSKTGAAGAQEMRFPTAQPSPVASTSIPSVDRDAESLAKSDSTAQAKPVASTSAPSADRDAGGLGKLEEWVPIGGRLWASAPLMNSRTGTLEAFERLEVAKTACSLRKNGARVPDKNDFSTLTKFNGSARQLDPDKTRFFVGGKVPTGYYWIADGTMRNVQGQAIIPSMGTMAYALCVKNLPH